MMLALSGTIIMLLCTYGAVVRPCGIILYWENNKNKSFNIHMILLLMMSLLASLMVYVLRAVENDVF